MSTVRTANSRLDRIYKIMVVMAIGIYALVLARDIVLPVVFAAIFSVVLTPIAKKIESKTGRIFSITIVIIGSLLLMSLVTWFVIAQLTALVASLPNIETQYLNLLSNITQSISEQLGFSPQEQVNLLKNGLSGLSTIATEVISSTGYLAYFFFQVPIYIFLFLLYREKFKQFFEDMSPGNEMHWKKEVEDVIRGYISGLSIVVFIAGVLNSIGLLILGIDHAIFFGFLSGALTVIPYVGITVGAALPALLALITKDSLWYAVGVVGVHAFVQFLEGNFITPKVTGSRISINAMAAILALLIGGKIWGIPGMILAVPTVGILKILFSYTESLKPLSSLMDDSEPTKSVEPPQESAPSTEPITKPD
jgi:predicted PurR-regulated permease PerM